MKKKHLLQDWEDIQREYYSHKNKSEVEEIWANWFESDTNWGIEKSQFVDELIADELEYRKDDSVEELEELIGCIKKLIK